MLTYQKLQQSVIHYFSNPLICLLFGIVLGMFATDYFWLDVFKHLDQFIVCP